MNEKETVIPAGSTNHWHNLFHYNMPNGFAASLMGLVFDTDICHIFYAYEKPHGSKFGLRHLSTREFCTWHGNKTALLKPVGLGSGCAFIENNKPHLLYSQKEPTGTSLCDGCWDEGSLSLQSVQLPDPPAPFTLSLKAPFFFQHRSISYIITGGQAEGHGCLLLYQKDEDCWRFLRQIRTQLPELPAPWDYPLFMKCGGHDVLFFTPEGQSPGYIAGHFSLSSGEMVHDRFYALDEGSDFFAPKISQHEGRHLLLAWLANPQTAGYPNLNTWRPPISLPRILTLRQGQLYSQPSKETRNLRLEEKSREIDIKNCQQYETSLPESAEILVEIELGKAAEITFSLLYGTEKLDFIYTTQKQEMRIDRASFAKGPKNSITFPLAAENNLCLHIFSDKTIIEAFFQYGEKTLSLLIFPKKNIIPSLKLHADKPLKYISGRIWTLDTLKNIWLYN